MKIIKRILLGSLISSSIILPSIILLSCNMVNGKLNYEIVGLNANKTDFIINVKLDNQYIARIMEKNLNDKNTFFDKLKSKILNDLKKVFPKEYITGIFKNELPSVIAIDKKNYKIYFPINEKISNLPKLNEILNKFKEKYNKTKDILKRKKEFEDEIFFGIDLAKKNNREEEINKKYNIINDIEEEIKDKSIIDFHYLGIAPYMSGKLTDDILKNIFSNLKNSKNSSYQNVEEFLNENFDGKLNMEQIKKTFMLSSNFELKQWQNVNANVFFYISKIKTKNPLYKPNSFNLKQKNEYLLVKDSKKPFSVQNENKAEIHYSLFLEKNIVPKNSKTIEIDINDKRLIEESTTKDIFVGLKKGIGLSRPILINKNKFQFEFVTNKQINDDLLKYFIEANLGKIEEKNKDANGNPLYQIKYNDKFKAIISFDIKKILTKDKNENWITKSKDDIVKVGDKVVYENTEINYIGKPFKGGESSSNGDDRNHMMFIDIKGNKSGFIKGFDKLIVDNKMKIKDSKFITPIFPADYNKKNLAGKLVKFKIKINRIMNRKTINNQFFIDNNIENNLNNGKMLNNNDLWKYINQKFRQDLLIDLITNYISKADAKIPYIKIEKKIAESYRTLYVKNLKNKIKKEPKFEDVKKHAKELAALDTKFNQFLKDNNLWAETKIEKNKKLTNYLISKIS